MNKLLLFVIPIICLFLANLSFAASPFTLNLSSNTIYQNTNSTPLSIYVIAHSTSLKGYLGNTNTTLTEVINIYSTSGYNLSAYMQVAPKQYYKFNFTNTTHATFIGEYSSSNIYLVSTKTITAPQYSTTAQALFSIGLLLSLLLLLLVFRVLKFHVGIIGGIEGFAVGMIAAILIIYSLQFVSVVQAQPHTITAFNSTLSVASQSVSTTPLASQPIFAILGYSFTFIDFMLSFIYIFLSMLVFKNNRDNKKYT